MVELRPQKPSVKQVPLAARGSSQKALGTLAGSVSKGKKDTSKKHRLAPPQGLFRARVPISQVQTTSQKLKSFSDNLKSGNQMNGPIFQKINTDLLIAYSEKETNFLDIFSEVVELGIALKPHASNSPLAKNTLKSADNFKRFLIKKISLMTLSRTDPLDNLLKDLNTVSLESGPILKEHISSLNKKIESIR
jgi:hypothetical protein